MESELTLLLTLAISISSFEAIDSWLGADDSYYRLYVDIESNNVASSADSISLGEQFEEFVCARDCDNHVYNPNFSKTQSTGTRLTFQLSRLGA